MVPVRTDVIIVIMMMTGVSFTGCISSEEAMEEHECSFFLDHPDRQELMLWLFDKWGGNLTDEDYANRDAARFGVHSWGALGKEQEPPGGQPDAYVNWTQWGEEERPEILQDVLCFTMRTFQEPGQRSSTSNHGITVGTRTEHAQGVQGMVQKETIRQTGVWLEEQDCCYVLFEDMYHGTGYAFEHIA